MSAPVSSTDDDATTPLWRAAQVFRLLSVCYAFGFQLTSTNDLLHPVLGWLLFAVLVAWSGSCAWAYLRGPGRRPAWVVAEFAVVAALVLCTQLVASPEWIAANQSLPTTLWATNATISAAIQCGPVFGMLTGLAVIGLYLPLKGQMSLDLTRNASLVIELAAGLAIGMAAQTARRAHAELRRATQLAAAIAEREKLARHVHDGVLQILALVAKRGREIGGPTADLAELAAGQERALRRLISVEAAVPADSVEAAVPADSVEAAVPADSATVDLGKMLRGRAGDRVVVSVPGPPVPVDAGRAAELDAAVTNILSNVAAHAGPDATAYVLLEDLGDTIAVSIRDDGVGMPPGRLEQAVSEGRMGIAKSVIGRIQALAGTARVSSEPGAGTEWELEIPRRAGGSDG